MKHATVKQDGYDIPLIGVPQDSTVEQCDGCKKPIHIQEVKLNESGKILCARCSEEMNKEK